MGPVGAGRDRATRTVRGASFDIVRHLGYVLKESRVYFLKLLAEPSTVVYSKKALDENQGDLRTVIAPGTGPFMFKEHKQAERWVFVRNRGYWDRELPYLDSLELLHVPAWTDRGTAVLTGQADMSWNVSRPSRSPRPAGPGAVGRLDTAWLEA